MRRCETLPEAFGRLDEVGGVLDFTVFEDACGTRDEIIAAIAASLPQGASFDEGRLRSLGARPLTQRAFFGDWWNAADGALLKVGEWRTAAGKTLRSPAFKALDGIEATTGNHPIPDCGSGGQFAYAFSTPPYSLRAAPSEIQALFDEIRRFVLPAHCAPDILDWSSPALPEVSDYFDAGMEWWGVFLFSIFVPDDARLTIAMASTTD